MYRFSPIQNEAKLIEAVRYVGDQCAALAGKMVGTEYTLSYITIFSHDPVEFENLKKIANGLGVIESEHNGPKVLLSNPTKVGHSVIKYVRIRHPDSARPEVGCGDYEVDFENFVNKKPASTHLVFIEREEFDMYEFRHPDFDVLGYVVGPDKN